MIRPIMPCLWFESDPKEPVELYVSLLPDSRIDRVSTMAIDSPSGPEGSVHVYEFTLAGQRYMAFNGGPLDKFNHAISFYIECDTQAEVDGLWNKLLETGGTPEQCGWIRDRWGLAWQIAPKFLGDAMADKDRAKAKRVGEAMMEMVKLDLAELKKAAEG
jgi:predicted 3-demethylubiquinone-9 3-methyltransferase (glyoxalase superfamily)